MVKCLVTKLQGVVNNDSLLKLGELRIPCFGNNATAYSINGNEYSVVYFGTNKINVDLLGENKVTFTDGTTTLSNEDGKSNSKNILGDKAFTLSVVQKYNIKGLYFCPTAIDRIAVDTSFDLSELGAIPELRFLNVDKGYKGNIDETLNKAKNIKSLYIFSNLEFSLSSISASLKDLVLTSRNVKGVIADLKKFTFNEVKDWAQTINDSSITGDLADIPSTVCYINSPYSKVSWTKGKRSSGSIMAINTDVQLGFVSHADVDNMFIDQSTCTLNSSSLTDKHSGNVNRIKVKCPSDYTPSSDAQSAIRTLYEKGLTNIIVNGVEMNSYK